MLVNVLKAVPAAGKTKVILEEILTNNRKSIVASISVGLSNQSYEYYTNMGGTAYIIDNNNKQKQTVNESIVYVMKNEPRVLFITHAALFGIRNFDIFKGYDLYIDEVPEMVSVESYSFSDNIDLLLKFCMPIDKKKISNNLKLNNEKIDELKEIIKRRDLDIVTQKMMVLYETLINGNTIKLIYKNEGNEDYKCYFINDKTVINWGIFESITIACANFEETFSGCILKHWCGWEIVESPLRKNLLFYDYENTERVTIHVMFDNNWSRYQADRYDKGSNVYTEIERRVEDLFKEQEYIFTTNSYRAQMDGEYIQYNPHGLNCYSNQVNVVALFSYNPIPCEKNILQELSVMNGLDKNTLVDAYITSKYFEPLFQLCTRCDIRNNGSDKKITLVVPDMRAALYIKQNYIKNAKIDTSNQVKSTPIVKKASMANLLDMSPNERDYFYKWQKSKDKKFDVNDKLDVYEVRAWLIKKRSK